MTRYHCPEIVYKLRGHGRRCVLAKYTVFSVVCLANILYFQSFVFYTEWLFIQKSQGTKYLGHSGHPRQPILPPDNPISFSGFPSDNQLKKIYRNICIVSLQVADYLVTILCVLKQYGRGCTACKLVRQATFNRPRQIPGPGLPGKCGGATAEFVFEPAP